LGLLDDLGARGLDDGTILIAFDEALCVVARIGDGEKIRGFRTAQQVKSPTTRKEREKWGTRIEYICKFRKGGN
jgi:hypothetical protein